MHYQTFTHTVAATGAGLQRRFVNHAGAQAGAADVVFGVAKTDFAAGQDVAVDYLGAIGVEAGGAIALGAPIIPDAQGRAVADAGAAANRVGRALNAVSAAGQTVIVCIK